MDQEIGEDLVGAVCPLPIRDHNRSCSAMAAAASYRELLSKVFLPAFANPFSIGSTIRPVLRSKARGWRLLPMRSW